LLSLPFSRSYEATAWQYAGGSTSGGTGIPDVDMPDRATQATVK
jgi:hypothetical protein